MSGKVKKWLAILAAAGITASGVTDFLNHLMGAFPNKTLSMICSVLITLVGLAVAYFPVSVKAPDQPKEAPKEEPAVKPHEVKEEPMVTVSTYHEEPK